MKITSEEFIDSNERYVLTLRRGNEYVRVRLNWWQVLLLCVSTRWSRLTGKPIKVWAEEVESSDGRKNS